MVLKVTNHFQSMLDTWHDYKLAKVTNNVEMLKKIMGESGGLLTNRDLTIDIDAIMGMIAVYQMDEGTINSSPDDLSSMFNED
jgi:hypothetical protein